MFAIDIIAYYAKAAAGLVSAVATSLLAVFGADTEVGRWLTIAVAVSGAIAVYAIPNRQPAGVTLTDPESLLSDEYEDELETTEHINLDDEPGEHRRED